MSKPNEIIPLILFFLTYMIYGFYQATLTLVFSTFFFLLKSYIRDPQPLKNYLGSLLVIVFGSLSLLTQNPLFLVWKPTIMYGGTALALLGGQIIYKHSLSEKLFKSLNLQVKDYPWYRLDMGLAAIFCLLAMVNLQVYHLFGLEVWVKYKLMSALLLAVCLSGVSAHVIRGAAAND